MPASTADHHQRSYSRHLSATDMSNSSQQNAYSSVSASMSVSPPPPTDLSSYSRTMHQHTKQMMEAVSRSSSSSHRRGSSRNHNQGVAPQQNGVSAGYSPPTNHRSAYHNNIIILIIIIINKSKSMLPFNIAHRYGGSTTGRPSPMTSADQATASGLLGSETLVDPYNHTTPSPSPDRRAQKI
ncbi:hypothetical protein MAPG_07393 [Magnaporthiopsis poae ATCC 64411]|uniref:Uncharacterized protein n=1 Tax=Magnaporthiopsis poae (strain ATCC 64411 / 73-15) TaxID=644358 RepID=A0A0C4E4J8_MAGP6|nr:hypothetical protein MAPG_07393 [Magnaporthiopsis poae ATCC 64411]